MRERIREIFHDLHQMAFVETNTTNRIFAIHELGDFTEHLREKGISYFMDLMDIYKSINSTIRSLCINNSMEGISSLTNDEISLLIEWVPLEKSTVGFISNFKDISESVVFAATQKLIEQGQFWDEDGNGPEGLVDALFQDSRSNTGLSYLDGLWNSGEKDEDLAQSFSSSLRDALKSGSKSFIGYYAYRDDDLAVLFKKYKKSERFNFKAASKLCIHNAPALSLEIGALMNQPLVEDLLELDFLGRVDFIEACISLHDGYFEKMVPHEYLSYLARANHWPVNAFKVPLNIYEQDVRAAICDECVTLDYEGRAPAFFYYVTKHFKEGPAAIFGLLKSAIERNWMDRSTAIACMSDHLDKYMYDFSRIIELFSLEWLDELDTVGYRKQINTKIISHLDRDADTQDIASVFNNEKLLDHLNWDDLIGVIDNLMYEAAHNTQYKIFASIPKKYHSSFNSLKRFSLESDLGI